MNKKMVFIVLVLAFCGSLVASHIQLLSPLGGECWQAGKTIQISWEQEDIKGDLQIVLYKEGLYYANIGKVPARAGKYSWRIPAGMPPAGDYSLRVYQDKVSAGTPREFSIMAGAASANEPSIAPGDVHVQELPDELVSDRFMDKSGEEVMVVTISGRPPHNYRAPAAVHAASAVTLGDMPAYDWSFGCSATSAAMMAGYYDIHGYPNMYTGPTNDGTMPLDNSSWGTVLINGETRSQCPLSATRQGVDGRGSRGHVDDYWIKYGSSDEDPYITNGWTQHAYSGCTGDYMKTNQSAWDNSDGATSFYYYEDGSKFDEKYAADGGYGFELFMKSRGYTITERFTQLIYGYGGNSKGFTLAQYRAEINAGRPVMIQVEGHTMVGYGYEASSSKIYIHDTWDYSDHSMSWGGSYSGLQMWGVVVLNLVPATGVTLTISTTAGGTTSPTPGSHSYSPGTKVKVKAIPSANYEFVKWSGSSSSTAATITLTMNTDKSLKANFRLKPRLTLSSSSGGTTSPAAGTHYYATGTNVTITAIPTDTYAFKSWSGHVSGSTNPITVTMSADKAIKANFQRVFAPTSVTGRKQENRSFSQREIIGILTWQANGSNAGLTIEKYRVYLVSGGSRALLGEVAATATLEYWHRRAGSGQLQYEIVAVAAGNYEGVPAGITIN